MPKTVCDDCGETITVNHLGQSIHRCDFQQASREAAERLAEVLVDEADYWLMFDTWITLTLHESGYKQDYRLCVDGSDVDVDTVMPVDRIESRTKRSVRGESEYYLVFFNSDEWGDGPRLKVVPGHTGGVWFYHYREGDSGYIENRERVIDVEVEKR